MKLSLATVRKNIIWYGYASLHALCNFKPEENLLICSGPRSGSTWMAELINLIPKTVILDEPLHLGQANPFDDLHFAKNQYISEYAQWDDAKLAFEAVFRGKFINSWTCTWSSPCSFLTADKMVIKFCKANALLPWLTRTFNFKYAPIYLVRHPFAVAASKLQHRNWSNKFAGFKIPECPFKEFYSNHEDFLTSIRTPEERFVAIWCLTNSVPLKNARNDKDWVTIYYEQLLTDPRREIHRIFDRWQLAIPDNIFDKIGKPSGTTTEATFKQGAEKQLLKWRSSFDANQLKKMIVVLDYFGVEHYGMDPLPKRKKIGQL